MTLYTKGNQKRDNKKFNSAIFTSFTELIAKWKKLDENEPRNLLTSAAFSD
jgi:hypothetical protein